MILRVLKETDSRRSERLIQYSRIVPAILLCLVALLSSSTPAVAQGGGASGASAVATVERQGAGYAAQFIVTFSSSSPGQGYVLFGPSCSGLVMVATDDAGSGTTQHSVTVTGDEMHPGTAPVLPGETYWYKVQTVSRSSAETDDNTGKCYSVTVPTTEGLASYGVSSANCSAGPGPKPVLYCSQDSARGNKGDAIRTDVSCPAGTVVTGGGFDVHFDGSSASRYWAVEQNFPDAGANAWLVQAHVIGQSSVDPYTAYAICAPKDLLPGISYGQSQTVKISNFSYVHDIVAPCPNGDDAISGGYRFADYFVVLRNSQPNFGDALHSWTGGADNGSLVYNSTLTNYSVCVPASEVPGLYGDTATSQTDTNNHWGNPNTGTCKPGTSLIGGGAGTTLPTHVIFSAIRPSGGNTSWYASGYDAALLAPGYPKIFAFGMCAGIGHLANGLVGWWPFDEGTGSTAADVSGYGNTATFQGPPSWRTDGRFNAAVRLNGSNYLAASTKSLPASNAPQTLSFWLNVPQVPTGVQDLVTLTDNGQGTGVEAGFQNGQFGVWRYGGTFLVKGAMPSPNAWHHIVYTFDGTTHHLWEDGVLQGATTVPPNSAPPTSLLFGAWRGVQRLEGSLDDVRIYNRVLSDTEIKELDSQP